MRKSIFLFFAAILCAIGMNAATVTSDGTARLYFNLKAVSWWNAGTNGNGNFAYFFNNSTGKNAWSAHAVQYSGDTYYVVIPNGTWAGVILTRNNTSTSPSWDNKWNQTGDITLSDTKNYLSKFAENSTTVTWSTQKPTSTASVTVTPASVFEGAQATLSTALTSNANINTIKSVTYTTEGATIDGDKISAETEGTYTVTATVTYHPNGYASITSTATATTTLTVLKAAETTHDVTVAYMCGEKSIKATETAATIGEETASEVAAPKITGYTFVGWTLGTGVASEDATANPIHITTKAEGEYTLTANYEEKLETIYFVNTDQWETVYLHKWDGTAAATEWPGETLAASGEKIGEYDVYAYTAKEGDYANVIFHENKENGGKSPDLTWTAGKYYVYNGETSIDEKDWYENEEVETKLPDWLATNVSVAGAMNEWDTKANTFRKATKDATIATLTLTLDASKKYEFKIVDNGTWKSNVTGITENITGWTFTNEVPGNCSITTSNAGVYTFTWEFSTSKLSISYPELPKYTVTTSATEGGSVTEGGEYTQGTQVTLTATPAEGYHFVKWSNESTDNPLTINVTENVALEANFAINKYTVSVIAENGTVTGAGEYAHGETVTLTAKADFDYELEYWLDENLDILHNAATYTFEATRDIKLTVRFLEVEGTSVAETGVFTIGEHKTAVFATGNLQYKKDGENETWRFAKQQYQVVGEQNIELGHPEFTGWIDMLGWSTNNEGNNFGVNPNNVNELYDGEFVDWGTKMGAEWSTLSADDWKYLLNDRANAAALKQVARVGEMVGILLFPDVWTMPEGCTVEAAYNEYYDTELYNYTLAQWAKMEAEGAMFLPAAGRRTGGWGNTAVSEQFVGKPEGVLDSEGHYKHFDNFNDYCYYWTSTINEETKNVSYLHNIVALGNDEYTIGTGAIWSEKGRYGQSVRLAKVSETPMYTVSVVAAHGTVTGAGEYEAGATATLTATANKGYHFVNWTVAGGTISTEATLDYVVNANVEIVANFHATTILVQPGEAKLNAAVQAAHAGDTLVLVTGEYEEPWSYDYNKEGLVVMAAEGAKPVIALTGEYTALNVSASTTFDGITFDGTNVAKYIIATLDSVEMDAELTITNCEFKNWTLWAISNQYANNVSVRSVVIDNCLFHDGTGAAISFSNNAPEGKQACEYFEMTNSTLYKISESSYRGIINVGSNPEAEGDYNTVVIDHITMYDYTLIKSGIAAIAIRKTHNLRISNSIIANPEDNGYTALNVYGGTVDNTIHYNGAKRSGSTVYTKCYNTDPMFVDAANGNFALASDSPARGKATDGSDLGDPRWYTAAVKYNVTATANPAEAGTVTGAGEYAQGVEVTLTAEANRGYNFVNWTVEGVEVSTSATYTFTPSAAIELVANFEESEFTGNIINVEPGKGTLMAAVEEAEAGDKLVLTTGEYSLGYLSGGHIINKEGLIITAAKGEKPVINYTDAGAYIKVDASITFDGITFDGGEFNPTFLIVVHEVAVENINIYNCEFKNYAKYAISDQWERGCHIGSMIIDNCLFHNGGAAVYLSKKGFEEQNPCDNFSMTNTTLYNITASSKSAVCIPSLGESVGTNQVIVDHCTFYNCTSENTDYGAVAVRGAVKENVQISNNIFAFATATGGQRAVYSLQNINATNCLIFNYSNDSGTGLRSKVTPVNCLYTNPLFVDAANGNFNLLEGSPAIGAATDDSNLGDPRWVVSAPVPTTYKVTLTINEPTYGSVTGLENEGVYEEGEEVTLIVAPGTGYELFYWTIDEEDIEGLTYTFTITKDVEINVFFKATQGEGGNTGTNLDNILVGEKAAKVIINGQLVIIKNGKAFNVMGQEI